jgi:hypothetical protein
MVMSAYTFRILSQHGERQIDCPSTELALTETPHRLSQRAVRLHVNRVDMEYAGIYKDSALTQLMWSSALR